MSTDRDLFGDALDGDNRDELDRYYTPDQVALALARVLPLQEGVRVVEPSVGGGAWARAIRAIQPRSHIYGVDVDPDARGRDFCDNFQCASWLDFGDFVARQIQPDVIAGNPPFREAQEHVEVALAAAPVVAFLLRSAFAESDERWSFWSGPGSCLAHEFTLVDRIDFGRGKPSPHMHSLFVWLHGHQGPARKHIVRIAPGHLVSALAADKPLGVVR